jgi:hypothetical protein
MLGGTSSISNVQINSTCELQVGGSISQAAGKLGSSTFVAIRMGASLVFSEKAQDFVVCFFKNIFFLVF